MVIPRDISAPALGSFPFGKEREFTMEDIILHTIITVLETSFINNNIIVKIGDNCIIMFIIEKQHRSTVKMLRQNIKRGMELRFVNFLKNEKNLKVLKSKHTSF